MSQVKAAARAGVYIHLPFCPYICPYCDFAKWPHRASQAQQYLDALLAEIDAAPDVAAETVFIGGGTPNTYAPQIIADLVLKVRERFSLPAGAEITIEVNPDPDRCAGFAAYAAAGVTRLSIGAQSFDAAELRTLGRQHSARDIESAVTLARAAGIGTVSLDLMFGTPGTSTACFESSLESAIATGVDHISTYGLTIEPGTPYAGWFERSPRDFLDDEAEGELYERAIARLGAAGFEHYEISNFARPGRRCRHNENYWRNGDYLGLGVGAASFLGGVRSVHSRSLEEYLEAARAGAPIPGESERLVGLARTGEAAMLALRTVEGVNLHYFKERYGVDFLEQYGSAVDEMRDAGLLEVDHSRVALTRRGRFLANDVCAAFIS